MGATYPGTASKHPEVPFFIVSFDVGRICVFNAEDKVVSILRDCSNKHLNGIEKEKVQGDVIIIKLKKSYENSDFDNHRFVNCMCFVLEEFSQAGYVKIFSCNMNWWTDSDVWFFYKSPGVVARDIEFCAVDLKSSDEMHLFKCSQEIIQAVCSTVNENWVKGVQTAQPGPLYHSLKLKGTPWKKNRGRKSVTSRVLMIKMLQCMSSHGWSLYSACNFDEYLDTLFFCKKPGQSIQQGAYSSMFGISINKSDRVRVINASESVVGAIKSVIEKGWTQIQKEVNNDGCVEFKLKGRPWLATKDDCVPVTTLFCAMFTQLRRMGWKVLMNIGQVWDGNGKGVFYFVRISPRDTKYCALNLMDAKLIYGVNMSKRMQESLSRVFAPYFDLSPKTREIDEITSKWVMDASPFSAQSNDALKFNGQMLLANLVHVLMGFDYHLCHSANLSGLVQSPDEGADYKPNGDTLFFALDEVPLNVGLFTDRPQLSVQDSCLSDDSLYSLHYPYPVHPPPKYESLYP